jgi:flagellar motility protein MotE (MotC chaperone)
MRSPRLLPLLAVAAGGLLAVKGLASIEALPSYLEGARAFAEETVKAAPGKLAKLDAKSSPMPPQALPAPSKPPAPVCAPTAAELAKEAGLSPAELQLLQSLGARRGQLDQREKDFDTQLALMAAAEGKLDSKIATLNALKAEIRGLMGQADAQKATEIDRLVTVYQAMKPRDAAVRMTLIDDAVRLPIAAKMKERSLSAIIAQMPPAEAKALTEKLAARFDPKLAAARAALANAAPAATPPPPAQAAAKPTPAPVAPPAAKPAQVASIDPLSAQIPEARPAARKAPAAKPKPRPKAKAPVKTASAALKPETGLPVTPTPYAALQGKPAAAAPAPVKPAPAAAPIAKGDTAVPVAPPKPT